MLPMLAPRNPLTLAALVSLRLAGPGNWPLWRALVELPELDSTRGPVFIGSHRPDGGRPEPGSVARTMLGLLGVSSSVLKPARDLSSECRIGAAWSLLPGRTCVRCLRSAGRCRLRQPQPVDGLDLLDAQCAAVAFGSGCAAALQPPAREPKPKAQALCIGRSETATLKTA